jgi:hypothetical protein
MPEIKQNFIQGKMNKDLDERLLPKGEYREAQNIHVTESEGSDAGAIENILSNELITTTIPNLSTSIFGDDYEVLGYCKDLANKRIVYFITNFTSDSFTDDIRSISRANGAGSTYLPYGHDCAIILYNIEDQTQNTLVHGPWLNFSKNHLITGVQIIEDLLFWTDNLNQPRKINIQKALDGFVSKTNQYYDCEENISVAKYAPYKAIMLHSDNASSGLPDLDTNIKSDYMKERFIRFSYRYKYDDGEYSLIAPFTQAVFEPLNKGIITNSFTDDERNSTTGEPAVLTGKKEVYKKGIVDIMQNRINKVELRIPLPNKNEFGNYGGIISDTPWPVAGSYYNDYNIKEIDIILKESDGVSFKLVKTIKLSEVDSSDIEIYTIKPNSTSNVHPRSCLKYTYRSSEPFKVLPESEVTRVYDQVPTIAKALEIVGNRVVFGNYVEGYNYPTDINNNKGLNYTVSSQTKGFHDQAGVSASLPYLEGLKQWMHKTYKYHTVKQRRTYQIGVVFSDIYGRQSPVILSSNVEFSNPDTYTMPEVTDSDFYQNTDGAWSSDSADNAYAYGKSLVLSFQDNVLTNDSKFVASILYDTTANISKYNPHGWYSYRIVVKQQEQEYYNIYTPHPFDGWDNEKTLPDTTLTGGRSWLSLYGDNINKVPRSLSSNDLNRPGTMGSDVRLYPKVVNDGRSGGIVVGENRSSLITIASNGITSDGDYEVTLGVTNGVSTSGTGDKTKFKITVVGGSASDIEIITPGRGFEIGDTINISPTALPGASVDVVLTIVSGDLYEEGESAINSSYHQLAEVASLGTAFEQNLFLSGDDNKSGTGGFSVLDFVYGKDKNPLVAELQNMKAYNGLTEINSYVFYAHSEKTDATVIPLADDQRAAPTHASISTADLLNDYAVSKSSPQHQEQIIVINTDETTNPPQVALSSRQTVKIGDKLVFSRYREGLSVFETEPLKSNIDVYYETSTSGLVADLVKEILVDPTKLATDLTIKQDTYTHFGSGQDPLGSTEDGYGSIAYLYENLGDGIYIGDLNATAPTHVSKSGLFVFGLVKATRLGDESDATNKFVVESDAGTYKVKTVGDFIYRGSNLDKYDLIISVLDTGTIETAYLSVQVQVKNSIPTITAPTGNLEIRKDAGKGAKLISSTNTFTNGSTVIGGSVNKYTDVDIAFTFGNPSFNIYFERTKPTNDKYEIVTTGSWNSANATAFFNASESDRTITITATDNAGTTASTSGNIVDEDEILVANSFVYPLINNINSKDNALNSFNDAIGRIEVWATRGTATEDPKIDSYYEYELKVYPNNVIHTKSDLSETIVSGSYVVAWDTQIFVSYDFGSSTTFDLSVISINSSGVVTSIVDTYSYVQ